MIVNSDLNHPKGFIFGYFFNSINSLGMMMGLIEVQIKELD